MKLYITCLFGCFMFYSSGGTSQTPSVGDYFLTAGGKCADLGSEHASDTHENVHRGPCNGTVFQRWSVKADPSRPGRFLIEWFSNSGKYWSAENFDPSADHLTFDPRRDSAFQSWKFDVLPGGSSYQIVNDGNGKCVDFDVNGDGPDILLSRCRTSSSQSVALQPAQ
jgi:hypothetical protein